MTSPFSAAQVAALKGATHAGRIEAVQGPARTPAFYCCISGNTVGVDKDPVPVAFLDTYYTCPGEPIELDYSLSWSPTDTLATWDVDWGDGQSSNGVFPGAGTVSHPLGGYASAGKYDIVVTAEDTLGAEGTTQLQVIVPDCSDEDALDEGGVISYPSERWANYDNAKAFISGRNYVWINSNIEGGGNWSKSPSDQASTSQIEELKITREPGGTERMYAARWDGMFSYAVPPAGGWFAGATVDDMLTAAGLNPANYPSTRLVRSVAMIESKPGWGYAWWQARSLAGLAADCAWGVAFTRNGWASVAWSVTIDTIAISAGDTQQFGDGQVSCIQDTDGRVAYACGGIENTASGADRNYIYITTNYGVSWSQVGIDAGYSGETWCMTGGESSQPVYWSTDNGTLRGAAGGWGTLTLKYGRLSTYPENSLYAAIMDTLNIWEVKNGAVSKFGVDWPAGTAKAFQVIRRNTDKSIEDVLWIGEDGGGSGIVYLMNRTGGLTDITGSWNPSFVDYCAVARPDTEEYLVYP